MTKAILPTITRVVRIPKGSRLVYFQEGRNSVEVAYQKVKTRTKKVRTPSRHKLLYVQQTRKGIEVVFIKKKKMI